MKKDKKKENDWDDGRTVSPMGAEWMPWNSGTPSSRQTKRNASPSNKENEVDNKDNLNLSKAEKRGILIGAFRALLPLLACIGIAVALMFIFACLWLG